MQMDIIQTIRDIKQGKVQLFSDGSNYFKGFFVSYQETSTFKKRQKLPVNTISTKNTAKRLGTYHDAVSSLIKLGYLTSMNPENKARHFICEKSVENFNKNFVLIGSLAKTLKTNPTNLAEKILQLGIYPISSPDIDGALVTIFRRSDFTEDFFSQLDKIPSTSSKTGRKSTIKSDQITCPRIKKLAQLIELHGSATKLAQVAGISGGNLSTILHGKKPFGKLAAKRMEYRLGLAEGWFDAK